MACEPAETYDLTNVCALKAVLETLRTSVKGVEDQTTGSNCCIILVCHLGTANES